VIEVRETAHYAEWFRRLRDREAKARIDVRIRRLSLGNPGDVKRISANVSELRVDCGPGYRIYFTWRGALLIILLCGGDKGTQSQDIRRAEDLARALET
jgi:putative addiction module killer protein